MHIKVEIPIPPGSMTVGYRQLGIERWPAYPLYQLTIDQRVCNWLNAHANYALSVVLARTENEDQEDPFEDQLIEGDEAIDSPAGEETEKPSENLISEEPISEELTSEEPVSESLTAEEPVSDAAGEEPVTEALPGEAFVQETDAGSLIETQTDIQTVEEPESMIPGTTEEIIETVPDTEAVEIVEEV